jgi:hypothetical protein
MEGKARVALGIGYMAEGAYVWTWNGVFDIACLIAQEVRARGISYEDVPGIIDAARVFEGVKWLDAMSAAKHVFRSQHTDHPSGARPVSWSLDNMSKELLKGWQHYNEFIEVKKEFSFDQVYLRRRCELDTEATLLIGNAMWDRLTNQQRKALLIESESLFLIARSWMIGSRYDFQRAIFNGPGN